MPTPLSTSAIASLKPLVKHVTWHWTAGSWTATFDHYHFNITWDGKKARAVQTLGLLHKGSHVYKRNTGNIGISMCGMGRIRGKLHAIQPAQVEATAKLTAELCHLLDIPLGDCHDHAYFASLDGYGPHSGHPETRVDIGSFEPVVRKKAAWYLEKLKAGEIQPSYTVKVF